LQQYQGQWVVLYFYPKDDTPGCTTEACNFRDDIFVFRKMGVQILGVSLDDVSSHKEFAEKFSLPFSLLADSTAETAEKYGVVRNLGVAKFAKRETFIIDPQGRIAKHYDKVSPDDHSKEIQSDLAELMGAG
jgi:peroxiredoxin Q/BCP